MKKLFVSAIIVVVSYASFAQKSEVFDKGTNVINAGFGLGDIYWGTAYSYSGFPISFNASYEHGVTEKLGIGYIGVGGELSYSSTTYKSGSYKWRNTGVLVAGRASYHFALDGAIGEKLDPYAGVLLGYVIASTDVPSGYAAKASAIGAGAFAGAHYYFTPNFGVYAELGFNITSVLNTGLTFKF